MDTPTNVQEPAMDGQKAAQPPQISNPTGGEIAPPSVPGKDSYKAFILVVFAVLLGIGMTLYLSMPKENAPPAVTSQPQEDTASRYYMDYVIDSSVAPLTSNSYLTKDMKDNRDGKALNVGILMKYGSGEKPDVVVSAVNGGGMPDGVSPAWISGWKVKWHFINTSLGKWVYCIEQNNKTEDNSIYCIYLHGSDVIGIWSVLPEEKTLQFVREYSGIFPPTNGIRIFMNLTAG
jgi:hypothetical protein